MNKYKIGDRLVSKQFPKHYCEVIDKKNPYTYRLYCARCDENLPWLDGIVLQQDYKFLGCRDLGSLKDGGDLEPDSSQTTLPIESNDRKEYPVYSGPVKYFPKALAEVAHVCKTGNDKHNPGQPLHHARGKSSDHADCIMRHLIDMKEDMGRGVGYDENGVAQVAYIAWRALALAQEWFEKYENAPVAPGAKYENSEAYKQASEYLKQEEEYVLNEEESLAHPGTD